jgi:Na+-transporting NADH:ubiquinone oxidoreductase subunit NqrF
LPDCQRDFVPRCSRLGGCHPRLSCQITVEDDVTVEIPEKIVWGRREPGWF